MTTFYLSAPQLASLAALTNAGRKDAAVPILGTVNLTATPSEVTARATDRYMAAILTFPLGDTAHTLPDDGVTLTIEAADLIALAKEKAGFMLTVGEAEANGATLITAEGDAYGVTRTFRTATGNFPPVARLFPDEAPDDLPGGVMLNMGLLARLAKLTLPGEKPVEAARAPYALTYRDPQSKHGNHAPILASREGRADHDRPAPSLRVLVQPNFRTAA